MMKTVFLYSTSGCHLCDLAWDLLAPLITQLPLRLEEIDIAESDELIERYGIRIPVLQHPDFLQELNWPFDSEEVEQFFAALQKR